jgi:hypothetical protein
MKTFLFSALAAIMVSALAVGSGTAARADTTTIVCTDNAGTVVLEIRANSAASEGLATALRMSQYAQHVLGVNCSQGAPVPLRDSVTVTCTSNQTGDVVFSLKASRSALQGLGTGVKRFMAHAAERLDVSCSVG